MTKKIAYSVCYVAFIACSTKPKLDVDMTAKDLTPPQVVSITPANASTEIEDRPTITIVFNERMDAVTMNSTTITLKTSLGSVANASYEYDDTSLALNIKVVQSLYLNTQYTLTISDMVKDRAGNAMAESRSSFTTDVCPKTPKARPIFDNKINAMIKIGCTLYVGGTFTLVGEQLHYGAPLDAITGQKKSDFVYEPINGEVHAVAPDGEGGWYIGGAFTRVGNFTRNRLARIAANGEVLPWNPNADGKVRTISVSGSTVYVGGEFNAIGGVARSRFAAMSVSGSLLPWNPGPNNDVYKIAVNSGTIFIGGNFSAIAGQTQAKLAAFDSSGNILNWNPLAAASGSARVNVIEFSSDVMFIGGFAINNVVGVTRGQVAAIKVDAACLASLTAACVLSWNPDTYRIGNTEVYSIAISGTTLYLAGDFSKIHGSAGTSRSNVAALNIDNTCLTAYTTGCLLSWNPGTDYLVRSLAISGSTIFMGGEFLTVASQARYGLAAVDTNGTLQNWNPRADSNDYVNAIAINAQTVYAGGSFMLLGGSSRNRLAAVSTDGILQSWDPQANNQVSTLVSIGSTIYAGGTFSCFGSCSGGTENTNKWTRSNLAAISTNGNILTWSPNADGMVRSLAVSGTTVYPGGDFTCLGNCTSGVENTSKWTRNKLAAIDAASGNVQTWNPGANFRVTALTASGTKLYASGEFTCFGNCPGGTENSTKWTRAGLAAFDTGTGNILPWNHGFISPSAANSMVLSADGSILYAGGYFTTAGGQSRNRLAAFTTADGSITTWNPGAGNNVNGLALSGTTVYVSGDFVCVGDCASGTLNVTKWNRNRLAAFDTSGTILSWNPDADSSMYSLLFSGSNLYAGGDQKLIGGIVSRSLASFKADGSLNW